jgi:hypothetical protein
MTIRIVLGFIVTVALVTPVSASAAPPAKAKRNAASAASSRAPLAEALSGSAKDDYEAGKLLFNDGDYAGAALKFQRAYATSKDPRLLWNQAAAEKNLRRYALVESLVARYLREEGDGLSEADRAEAVALLDAVKSFVAEVKLEVSEPSAQVFVDDVLVGETPLSTPLRLDAGRRRLSVKKPGFAIASQTLELTGGEARVVAIELDPESTAGRLRVVTSGGATIRVDGKVVGIGQWEGTVAPGAHQVDVVEKGKDAYRERTEVRANDLTSLQITLSSSSPPPAAPVERERSGGVPAWIWVASGVALTGIGVGTYFLLKSGDEGRPAPTPGSLGTVNLPLVF